jgi:hypothetical protein
VVLKNGFMLGLLLAGFAGSAVAQSTATRPPSFGAAPRINPGNVSRQIGIRAGVEASYDSNVFGVSDAAIGTGSIQNRSKDDFSLSPTLQLDILLPFGRQSAFLRGTIGYDFYQKNSELNRERILLDAGANLNLISSCSAVVSGSYARSRSNAGDVFAVSPVPIATRNNTEERKSVGVQSQCGGGIGLTPTFGYQHTETRNSTPLFRFNDSNQDAFDASIGYQRPSLGRLAVYGSYSKGEYLNRNILGVPDSLAPGAPRDGVTSYSAGVRFERNIGSRVSGAIAAGYSWVDPKALGSRKFRGSSYSLNVNLRPTDRLSVDLLASRSADLSNSIFASYAVTEIYSLNGTYRLNPKIAVNFGSSVQNRDFREASPVIDQSAFVREDEFYRAYVGFAYDLNRRLRLNGLVSQQRRKSDSALFNYNNTTVSLGASFALGR